MIRLLCSVYDLRAKVFCAPFSSINEDTAKRDFGIASRDVSTSINKFPSDYQLFVVGSFDDETGEVFTKVPDVIANGNIFQE